MQKYFKMKNLIFVLLFTINVNMLMAQDFTHVFDSIEMVFVQGGSFTMGCSPGDNDCTEFEKPAHPVTVNSFYISKFEISIGLWYEVMKRSEVFIGRKISGIDNFMGKEFPAVVKSWDVELFVEMLNYITGKNYRLPTEAEWEYAARGGNKSLSYKFSGSNNLDSVANHRTSNENKFKYNYEIQVIHSGAKIPNEL